ncbi:hypothetical protein [Streptosporangium lutulentum]|uniref:Major facilitator superfamily (MFS) profile domain-containing protein n=1 Tax=Streptosporangium lutulentum TaxID=1461250 RepID=A0ABT9Q878_9ACTN|nr:hypothetical protein [Streptosporangium lutulentum]MDP9842926.1 hypothetical protein [Streptosporangium lutulentum]
MVAPGEAGLVSGILNSSRQIGGSLGLAALTTLAAAHTGAPTSGYALAFGVCAGVVTAGAVAVLALPKPRRDLAEGSASLAIRHVRKLQDTGPPAA